MTIEVEGFDQYGTDTSLLTGRGNWAESHTNISLVAGRTGNCLRFTEANGLQRRIFIQSGHELVMGFAFRKRTAQNASSYTFFRLSDNVGGTLTSFNFTSAGEFVVLGFNSPLNTIIVNAYQYVEFKIVNDPVNGSFEMRVDGVTVIGAGQGLPFTGLNTGSTPMAQFEFACDIAGNDARQYDIDDMYWEIGAIGTTTPMLGDVRASLFVPDGNGPLQDFGFVGAPSAWEAIDEVPDDGDTSYITALAPGSQSSFDLTDVSLALGTIYAVQTTHTSRKIDSGVANLQSGIVSGPSVAVGNDNPITQSYVMRNDTFTVDPNTGMPWTVAGLNAAQYRIEKTA